jgi:hypothetical protein
MQGDSLEGAHHVVRHLGQTKVDNGVAQSSGFLLKPKDEGALSVNWLEHCKSIGLYAQLAEIRDALVASGRSISLGSFFARLKVNDITSIAEIRGVALRLKVIHEPDPPHNLGHSSVLGLPDPNSPELAKLAALELAGMVIEPITRCGDL